MHAATTAVATKQPVYAGIEEAMAAGHHRDDRPLCLCVPGGVPMYLARHGDRLLVKRMPLTGWQHAPECRHHEPGPQRDHRGRDAGSTDTGVTPGVSKPASASPGLPGGAADQREEVAPGNRISLLALLHELWTRAELTRWHPGFAGKRHWGVVRRHLLLAARQTRTHTGMLAERLYVPEVFNVARADQIWERREARWRSMSGASSEVPLMVVVGEIKALRHACGFVEVRLKHLPDCPCALREAAFRAVEARFGDEIALWRAHGDVHLVAAATAVAASAGPPALLELALMACNAGWIPVANEDERTFFDKLVVEDKRFEKILGPVRAARDATDAHSAPRRTAEMTVEHQAEAKTP
ncbi:DUF1173 family protein [Rubrivivax gelatinosus]|uniref:DUF1173 family protein n=1 Tax=Rubrivivax gelatinosus TaxID=28068 RepID=A0ABS1DQ86_RUBGE|nr:DUF1173 family protein [Rubrivivax gelatinosus]MBK1712168.1 hypothetical protein [Rubrivivax gelatinosus]